MFTNTAESRYYEFKGENFLFKSHTTEEGGGDILTELKTLNQNLMSAHPYLMLLGTAGE